MNYFLGLVGDKLAADFEEAAGPNHSIIGTTSIPSNTWTHVAATYEPVSAVWNLYINGILDNTLDIGTNILPVNNSIQHAGIATAINSLGDVEGYFNGSIDEVRIWNFARPINEIRATINQKRSSGTGLIGRWGLDDGSGPIATNSISGGSVGSLINAPAWTLGAPYNVTFPLVLQDGVNGYTGTRDTYIYDVDPTAIRGTEATIIQDLSPGERRSLLKFDLSSLPAYSTIQSAELQFYVDAEGQGFTMHKMLKPWDEATITYTSNGGHFNADGIDAETTADAIWPGTDGYTGYITVTIPGSTIKAWRDGYLENNGWLLIATHADDGQQLRARESGTTADRPRLSITYTPVPLPVKLTAFNATVEGNKKVNISWTTASEKNNSHFEVQRSANGVHYSTIGSVAGKNNFSNITDYTFYDNQPLIEISYYRLKQVDMDEKFDYSSIARVKISGVQNVYSVFPNPVQGNEFKIYSLRKVPENVDVKLYDLNGRLHLQKQFFNSNLMTINHHLQPGLYTILITGNTIKESFKILIQ